MKLTHKERAVLGLMALGMKPSEVMRFLAISRGSYAGRRERILNKLGVLNDVQIGMLCERLQLLPVPEVDRILDRRDERLDAKRTHGGQSLETFLSGAR